MRYKYYTIQYCTAIGVTLIIDKYDWVSFFIGSETISVSFFLFLRAGYSHTHTYRYMHRERVRKKTRYIYWYIYSTSLFSRSIIIILYTRLRIKARRRLLQYTMEIHVDGKIKKKKKSKKNEKGKNVRKCKYGMMAWWLCILLLLLLYAAQHTECVTVRSDSTFRILLLLYIAKKKIVRAKILSIRKKRKNIFTSGLTVESPHAYAEKSWTYTNTRA